MSGTSKMPDDCFAYYVALGPQRSYEEVAKRYSVHKRTVARTADRERWPERLEAIETKARAAIDARLVHEMKQMDEDHLALLAEIRRRAVEAIAAHPLSSAIEGLRAAEAAIKLERLILGKAGQRIAYSVERIGYDEAARIMLAQQKALEGRVYDRDAED